MRRIALVLGVFVTLAAAGVAWWTMRAPGVTPAPGARAPSVTAPKSSTPVATISLQLNGDLAARVSVGTPAFFIVSVTGTASAPALRLGGPGRAWTTAVRFEDADGSPLSWRVEPLGRPVTYRFGTDERSETVTAGEEALLDDSRIHRAQFGIAPDEAARIAPGSYRIRVSVAVQNDAGAGPLVSNVVTLTTEPPAGDAAALAVIEKARLVAVARFNVRSARWEEAHRTALQLMERADRDASSCLLLGDALTGLRRDEEALAAYEEAMALLPKSNQESPDYLVARIEELRRRLEGAKDKKAP